MINRIKGFKPGLQSVDKRELYLKGIRSVVVLGEASGDDRYQCL